MGAKEKLCTWWIFILIVLLLWYRNVKYDRVLSIFLFTLAIIQLVEYAIYCGANPQQCGQTLYMTLFAQCWILAIGVFLFTRSDAKASAAGDHRLSRKIASAGVFLFGILFVVAMLYLFLTPHSFTAVQYGTHIEWTMDGRPMLGSVTWLYVLAILVPLVILFGYSNWSDPGAAALIIGTIIAMLTVLCCYNRAAFFSAWPYYAVIVAFIAWMIHAFRNSHIHPRCQPSSPMYMV